MLFLIILRFASDVKYGEVESQMKDKACREIGFEEYTGFYCKSTTKKEIQDVFMDCEYEGWLAKPIQCEVYIIK